MTGLRSDLSDSVRSLTPVRFAAVPRRWPWAVGAAVLGASAGAGVILLLRRVIGQDAPDALEPDELKAVVDTHPSATQALDALGGSD